MSILYISNTTTRGGVEGVRRGLTKESIYEHDIIQVPFSYISVYIHVYIYSVDLDDTSLIALNDDVTTSTGGHVLFYLVILMVIRYVSDSLMFDI